MSPKTTALISIVAGALSIVPFPYMGYLAPVALLFAIISLFRRQILLSLIGLILSVVGFITSPMLWALGLQAYCMVADCKQMVAHAAAPVITAANPAAGLVPAQPNPVAPGTAPETPGAPVAPAAPGAAPAPAPAAPGMPIAAPAAPGTPTVTVQTPATPGAPVVVQVNPPAAAPAPAAPAPALPAPAAAVAAPAAAANVDNCSGHSVNYKSIPGWDHGDSKNAVDLHGVADIQEKPFTWMFVELHKANGAVYYHDSVFAKGRSFAQIIDDSVAKVKTANPNMSFSKIDGQKTQDGHPLVLVRFAGLSNGRSEIAAFADSECFKEVHVLSAPTDQAMTDDYAAFVAAVVGMSFK